MWSIWVDTGGTFTDCIAEDPAGRLHRLKVLSDSTIRGRVQRVEAPTAATLDLAFELPDDFLEGLELAPLDSRDGRSRILESARDGGVVLESPLKLAAGDAVEIRFAEEVPVLAARLVTGTSPGDPLPPLAMRLATTRATNALLERSGADTAFFVTRGFADLLRIGTQQRPDLFALDVQRPEVFYRHVVEVEERLGPDGEIEIPLSLDELRKVARGLREKGVRSAAVMLLHSYRNPRHELEVEAMLSESGWEHVSRSSEVAPLIGAVPRAETTVIDAYLAPAIDAYLENVDHVLGRGRLRVMTSAGGLQGIADLHPKDCLLSGPAGGVVGASRAAAEVGLDRLISFDMGGTSTDVARYDGDYEYSFETVLDGARVLAPALAIETVAAGGGSICTFEAGRLRVGPESAGARPGPACYGAGGPLTLTDVNLLLGRLDAERFEIPLAAEAAETAFEEVRRRLHDAGEDLPGETVLAGFLRIADERMAETIRHISVRRGYDPTEYSLVAFGGAGGQHACAVAEQLGVSRILVPRDASLLSAWGLGHAVVERFAERQVLLPADVFARTSSALLSELEEEACERVLREGVPDSEVGVRRRIALMRLAGQDSTVPVEVDSRTSLVDAFERTYQDRFGYDPPDRPLEVESIRVVASTVPPARVEGSQAGRQAVEPVDHQRCFVEDDWREVAVLERRRMPPGSCFDGPSLCVERFSTVVIGASWSCTVEGSGALVLTRTVSKGGTSDG